MGGNNKVRQDRTIRPTKPNKMAYEFAKTTALISYKGHTIEQVESPMQTVFVVDGDRERAYWSVADAKRAINGKELTFFPVDVRHWFRNN